MCILGSDFYFNISINPKKKKNSYKPKKEKMKSRSKISAKISVFEFLQKGRTITIGTTIFTRK